MNVYLQEHLKGHTIYCTNQHECRLVHLCYAYFKTCIYTLEWTKRLYGLDLNQTTAVPYMILFKHSVHILFESSTTKCNTQLGVFKVRFGFGNIIRNRKYKTHVFIEVLNTHWWWNVDIISHMGTDHIKGATDKKKC